LQIKKILRKEKPEHLIYQGDTLSIACASLAGKFSRRRPRLSHIEAGIRTYNWFNPFPEEISRRIADRFSDFLFAPTELAKRNLLKEHVNGKIVVTGNTVVDATLQNIRLAEKIELALPEEYGVVFIHRQENVHFSDNLKNVLRFLKQVECEILFIEHPSAVQKFIDFGLYGELLSMKHVKRISLQDYLPFLKILKNAQFVLSDSGGIQEEACTLKFPCIVWRKTTERPEAVESGAAMLVGDDYQKALELVDDIKNKGEFYRSVKNSKNPFGDGKASERILDYLENQN
jgi:UDP-N-acetylglucosamine 2-epimerase (non-hydrolysing)